MNEKKFVHRKSHKLAWWMSRYWSETYHATIDGKTALCGVQGGLTGSNPFPEVLDASTDHRACAHCRRAVRLDTPMEGSYGNPDRYVWKTIGGQGVEMSIFGANGQLVKKELLALDEAFARWALLGEMMMLSSGTLDVSVRTGGLQEVGANAALIDAAKNPGEPPKVMPVEKNYGRPMPSPVQSRGAEHIRTDAEPIEVVATFMGSKEVGGKKFNAFSFKPVSGEWPKESQ